MTYHLWSNRLSIDGCWNRLRESSLSDIKRYEINDLVRLFKNCGVDNSFVHQVVFQLGLAQLQFEVILGLLLFEKSEHLWHVLFFHKSWLADNLNIFFLVFFTHSCRNFGINCIFVSRNELCVHHSLKVQRSSCELVRSVLSWNRSVDTAHTLPNSSEIDPSLELFDQNWSKFFVSQLSMDSH